MPEKPKSNPIIESRQEIIEAGKEKINFENYKRPKYRYYYHGTFAPLLGKIEKSGSFKFKEHVPNLTLSPAFGYKFLESEIKKGSRQAVNRGKHLGPDEKSDFKPEDLTEENSVLLVIEPTKEYNVHSTNEGRPNVFSTDDQIPADIDGTVRTRLWTSNQQTVFKEPISVVSKKMDDSIRRPGMHLNRNMTPTGELVKVEREKRINIPGEFPASSVKMAIRKDPEFFKFFQDIREEFNNGDKVNLADYKDKLIDYFKNSKNIIRNEFKDDKGLADEAGLAELAENMVVGEFEHFIATEMRKLHLEIYKFKGKKIITMSMGGPKEDNKPAKSKVELMDKIERMRKLNPDNEVFKEYIRFHTARMEKELNENEKK